MQAKRRLLYIDDELLMQRALERALRNRDCELHFASSGNEGLELVRAHHFDLVISDFRLWDMNGLEVLMHVGELQPKARRVLTSGSFDPEDNREAMEQAGVVLFVAKPWIPDELANALEQLLAEGP